MKSMFPGGVERRLLKHPLCLYHNTVKNHNGALRVVTYNIHKCRGLDRKVRPGRIVDVLGRIDADIVALQEVLCVEGSTPERDQASFIAKELGYDFAFGHNCNLQGGCYGNVLLSRFPIHVSQNHDISFATPIRTRVREPRGCLRADVRLGETLLHVFNVHLGTGFFERHQQAQRILSDSILSKQVSGPRIVLGDFNEWTRGAASRMMRGLFETAEPRRHMERRSSSRRAWHRTYPGVLPILNLDHIYFDPALRLNKLSLCRDRTALVASDHLPLVADFHLQQAA
jgi:endonuclease/exonuclease/phosphatase family metal-dependent hydrolase